MRTAQVGDRVQVRWTKLFQDGSLVSSRGRAPTELTIGLDHPRLPGLGLALVGLPVGESARLIVSARQGYGPFDPRRIHRLSRTWFPEHDDLPLGKWVRVWDRRHRPHLVRIVAVRDRMVVVATNHRWAGQALELEVKLLAILDPDTGSGADRSRSRARMGQSSGQILEGGGTRPSSDHSSPRSEGSFADSGAPPFQGVNCNRVHRGTPSGRSPSGCSRKAPPCRAARAQQHGKATLPSSCVASNSPRLPLRLEATAGD